MIRFLLYVVEWWKKYGFNPWDSVSNNRRNFPEIFKVFIALWLPFSMFFNKSSCPMEYIFVLKFNKAQN
jgi:hypothetical protein